MNHNLVTMNPGSARRNRRSNQPLTLQQRMLLEEEERRRQQNIAPGDAISGGLGEAFFPGISSGTYVDPLVMNAQSQAIANTAQANRANRLKMLRTGQVDKNATDYSRIGRGQGNNPLTVEVTRRLEPTYQGPQYGRGGTPTQEELQRQMIINRNRAGLLNVRNQNAVPPAITESSMSGNMAKREEEEDNPYDRQFFAELIANAYAASLGGKPPTPYAQGVGTLRNFTALPFA